MNAPTQRNTPGGGFDPSVVFALLLRHAWVILVTFVVVTGAVALLFKDKVAKVYESGAVVMVQPMSPPILGGQDAAITMWASFLDAQRYRSTQLRILTSSSILQRVVDRLDLENDPDFPHGPPLEDEVREPFTDHIGYLQRVIKIDPVGDTMLAKISVTCTQPQYCADIANALAETYVEFNYEQRISSGASAENWLRKQYEQRKKATEDAENALLAFRRERNLLSVALDDQYNLTGQSLSALASNLLAAEHETDRLATSMREIQRVRASGDYLSAGLAEVVENTLVQTLKGTLIGLETERASLGVLYLDEHPQMKANADKYDKVQATLEREIDAELSSLQLVYDTSVNLAGTIRQKMLATYEEALALGDVSVEYERLVRDAAVNRDVFQQLDRRLQEVELSNQLEPNNVQVMEVAVVPKVSINASGVPTLLIAAIAGLVVAFGLAFLLEMLDNTVKSQSQIEDDFGLPFLGIVPKMATVKASAQRERGPKKGEVYAPDTFVATYPRSPMAEAMRSLRTNLLFMSTDTDLQMIAVTSSSPLEGKSTIAISLATIMAQAGNRVLLVDNDLRKPRLHSGLKLRNDVGLTSIIAGTSTVAAAVQPSGIAGVDALVCGPLPNNPTELMLSSAYDGVLQQLRDAYDIIVLDAPPVNPVTDAVVLAQKVDGMLMVVRATKTKKDALRHAIDQLDAVAAPLLGVVLNDVDLNSRKQGYYYAYRQYAAYYGEDASAS